MLPASQKTLPSGAQATADQTKDGNRLLVTPSSYIDRGTVIQIAEQQLILGTEGANAVALKSSCKSYGPDMWDARSGDTKMVCALRADSLDITIIGHVVLLVSIPGPAHMVRMPREAIGWTIYPCVLSATELGGLLRSVMYWETRILAG